MFRLRGEYMSSEFTSFLTEKCIIHKKSFPHTPQQNGIVERKNRHILETVSQFVRYLIMTWPDMSHAVHTVSPFVSKPHKPRLHVVYRILRSIKGTRDRVEFLRKTPNSRRRRRSHIISLLADDIERYSASAVDFEIVVCFLHFHEIREAPKNMHHPVVE